MADEAYAEAVRLLYVAVTRAEQRCYLLTVEFDKCEKSPLGQTLHWEKNPEVEQSIQQLVNDNPDDISLITVDINNLEANAIGKNNIEVSESINIDALSAESFCGKIERDWWLSSFSALSRNLKHKGVSSPDRDNNLDMQNENVLSTLLMNTSVPITEVNISNQVTVSNQLRFVIEKGARTGNLLHNILENLQFNNPNWALSFEWPLMRYGQFTAGYSEHDLQHWLEQVLCRLCGYLYIHMTKLISLYKIYLNSNALKKVNSIFL